MTSCSLTWGGWHSTHIFVKAIPFDVWDHGPQRFDILTFQQLPWTTQQLRTTTFPDNLRNLTFGYYFNQCLDQVRFPETLECLTLGEYFNQSLEEVKFPSNLKSLTFGHEFCQSIDQVELPENLQFLRFGFEFRRDLKPLNHLKELCCRELMVSCTSPNDQWPTPKKNELTMSSCKSMGC